MRRLGGILPRLLLVGVLALAPWSGLRAAVLVTTCSNYQLATAGETYVLQNDCTTSGTAFISMQDNVILDLNGHTVTYGDANNVEVPNHGFETCTAGVPAQWDLSSASGATCVAKGYYYGSFELRVPMTTGPKTVKSAPVTLSANKTFVAFAWAKGGSGDSATLNVRRASDNGLIATYTRSDLTRGFAICDPYEGLTIPSSGSAQTVYLEMQLTGSGSSITVDEMDIKPSRDYGVVIGTYHDSRYHPDLPAGTPTHGSNLTIKNGTLRQGRGAGALSNAVRADNMPLTLDNVTLDVNGVQTAAFLTTGGPGGIVIRGSRMVSSSWGVFDRMQIVNVANVNRVCGNIVIQGNSFTGGAQGGIFMSRVRTDSGCSDADTILIEGNTIQHNETVTNGYGIMGTGWNHAKITNNTIQPTLGRGILLDSNSYNERNVDVEIFGNTIEVKEKPNFEYQATDLQTPAIRLRTYAGTMNYNINIHDNVLRAFTGPEYVCEANGITVNAGSGADLIRIHHNDIKVWSTDPRYRAYPILMQSIAAGNDIEVEKNTLESNTYCLRMGNNDGFSTTGVRFKSNTFKQGSEVWGGTFHTMYYGYTLGSQTSNDFLDGVYNAGTSPSDLAWDGSSSDMTISWFLTIVVQNLSGAPVPGATVTITNADGAQTVDVTGTDGRVQRALGQYQRSGSGSSYHYYSPYQIRVDAGGQTATRTTTLDATKTETFTLDVSVTPGPNAPANLRRTDQR